MHRDMYEHNVFDEEVAPSRPGTAQSRQKQAGPQSITSNSYGDRTEILSSVFDIRAGPHLSGST
jgi:hypothetical protein